MRPQDSQSHRVIEKRRRDRINSSLADLGRLLANDSVRQGHGHGLTQYASHGRVKKTEIIEMAIQRLRQLQSELLGLYNYRWNERPSKTFSSDISPPTIPHGRFPHFRGHFPQAQAACFCRLCHLIRLFLEFSVLGIPQPYPISSTPNFTQLVQLFASTARNIKIAPE